MGEILNEVSFFCDYHVPAHLMTVLIPGICLEAAWRPQPHCRTWLRGLCVPLRNPLAVQHFCCKYYLQRSRIQYE